MLVSFVAAAWWLSRDSRSSDALGMRGPVTVMTVQPGDLTGARKGSAQALVDYLDRSRIPLLVGSSDGEGQPGLLALGPTARVPWLTGAETRQRAVLLIKGSYSAQRLAASGTLPSYIPHGLTVTGTTEGPPVESGLQYVTFGASEFHSGHYVLGTRNQDRIEQVVALMASAGVPPEPVTPDAPNRLWSQPMVVATALALVCGLCALVLDWSLAGARLMPRLEIALRHGASESVLWRRMLGRVGAPIAAGSIAGGATTALIPGAADSVTTHEAVVTWIVVTAAAFVLALLVWSAVMGGAIRVVGRHAR